MTAAFLLSLTLLTTHDAPAKPLIPGWAHGALWYQIVPDRFRNAMPANDPTEERTVGQADPDWQVHPWAANWYKRQVWEADGTFESVLERRRFGGDLLGVIEKLPYLEDLGVTVIRLSPVFESPSILKYDATTFHHIDNNFGTARKEDWQAIKNERQDKGKWTLTSADSAFVALIEAAHKQGIRVVLEVEFNYVNRYVDQIRDRFGYVHSKIFA
jgi:glycosidase